MIKTSTVVMSRNLSYSTKVLFVAKQVACIFSLALFSSCCNRSSLVSSFSFKILFYGIQYILISRSVIFTLYVLSSVHDISSVIILLGTVGIFLTTGLYSNICFQHIRTCTFTTQYFFAAALFLRNQH